MALRFVENVAWCARFEIVGAAYFAIALRILFTGLEGFPFSRDAFRKCLAVTFPCIDTGLTFRG